MWGDEEGRLTLVPGKDVLARVNTGLLSLVGVSVSARQIAQQFRAAEIHADIRSLVDGLAGFSTTSARE